MKATYWKNRIKKACEEAGTYRPFFESVIETLAEILELRDSAAADFKKSGSVATVIHTNKAGKDNIAKNPAMVLMMDCNQQALAYWKELGLTPAGLKKINESEMKGQKKKLSKLEIAMKALTE